MKRLLPIIFITGLHYILPAQSGRITLVQDDKITELLALYKSVSSTAEFYTIQVGFGTYAEAEKLKSEVGVDFPNWFSKIVFDSPTYRVQLGQFRTKMEAEREFLEVRKKYPAALILKPEKKP